MGDRPPTITAGEISGIMRELADTSVGHTSFLRIVNRLVEVGLLLQVHEAFEIETGPALVRITAEARTMTITAVARDPHKVMRCTINPRPMDGQVLNGILLVMLKETFL